MNEVKSDEVKRAEEKNRLVKIKQAVMDFARKHGFIAGEDVSVLMERLILLSVTEFELGAVLDHLIRVRELTIDIRKRQFLHLLPT